MMNTPCVGIHGCGNASESYGVPAGLQRVVLLGVLTAAASAVQIAEAPIPRLLPWLKPGLANALVLFSLIRLSPGFAW
ncbi:MAG TPA: hypothetical protein PKM25_11205, partial [Candidatus Ozemobacteraceae bacterium]|nr:hypothetical protein [Candidatus Ozemobacteraceae bacterium]